MARGLRRGGARVSAGGGGSGSPCPRRVDRFRPSRETGRRARRLRGSGCPRMRARRGRSARPGVAAPPARAPPLPSAAWPPDIRLAVWYSFTSNPLLQLPEPAVEAPAPAPAAVKGMPPTTGGGSTGNKTGGRGKHQESHHFQIQLIQRTYKVLIRSLLIYQLYGLQQRTLMKAINSVKEVLVLFIRYEGVHGFYRGITSNLLKNLPAASLTFVVYENFIKLFRAANEKT